VRSSWPTRRLGDLCSKIGSGSTPRGGSDTYVEQGIPFVRSQNVIDSRLDLEGIARITPETHDEMKGSKVLAFDVLLNITGASIGRSAVVPATLGEANVSQHVCIIRCRQPLDAAFVQAWLSTASTQRHIRKLAAGGSREGLNHQQVASLQVPCPPREVQMAAMRAVEASMRIEKTVSTALEAKRRLKRALLQQVLAGAHEKSQRLGDVAELNPSTLPETTAPDFTFRYLDLGSVDHGTIAWPNERSRFCDAPSRARRLVASGDVLMATVRPTLLGFARLGKLVDDVVVSTGFAVLRAKNNADAEFIYQCLFTRDLLKQVEARLAGSSFPAIAASDVAALRIRWPSAKVRTSAASVLAGLDREIALLNRQLLAYRQLKRGLMQEMLLGGKGRD
jgi:type I restriction enzyme, S subunit